MKRTPWVWAAAAAITALSTVVGGFFGALSNLIYRGIDGQREARTLLGVDAGVFLGTAAGLAVGVAWCWVMLRRSDRERTRRVGKKLVAAPVGYGVLAGIVATAVLHLGMGIVYGFGEVILGVLYGEFYGVVAGAVVGAVGALVWPAVPGASPAPTPDRAAPREGGSGTLAG